ncbi:hypothetical protein FG386_003277 [Cryptosporidium ryanae]|uniref:uncharacterized protein n=1 Tax=Cryptosporidium ryanae TaxID=515981 RepID=UPI00351AABB0|nr:hypothetical protein FG386_003277 [Cryptosporidium ryanae]
MLESILESELGGEANIHPDFLYLKGELEKINESNIKSFVSIDVIYLTYIKLLKHKNKPHMHVGYRLISDRIVAISKILQEMPFSISKYLGCLLIMSIIIAKTEDWCNLNDLSNFNLCNFILNSIAEYYDNKLPVETDGTESYEVKCVEHFIKPSCISSGYNCVNLNQKMSICIEDTNLKRKRMSIRSKSKLDSEIILIIDTTIKNLDSITSIIGEDLKIELISFIRELKLKEDLRKDIFYKLYILNAIICFYRCSGSFLSKALSFKLPRGRYLIENGIGTISNFILKDMKIQNNKKLNSEFSPSSFFFIAIDYISMILWFKIYITRISLIVENSMQDIAEKYYFEDCKVNKEYYKLELLNNHSEILSNVISNFIERRNLNSEIEDNSFLALLKAIENILVKTAFEAIYTTFDIPLDYRNHFMMHFYITEISNNQVLNLIYHIGHLVKLTAQGNIVYTDIDMIIYIFRAYLGIIYSITRFGDSSTKKMFINYLSEGINTNFCPEMDKIISNTESFIWNKPLDLNSNKYRKPLFAFTKYCLYMATRLKGALSENLINEKMFNNISNYNISTKNLRVLYYEIASLIYTINFIGIISSDYSNKEKYKKDVGNCTFIEKIIIGIFSYNELKKILDLNQIVYSDQGAEKLLLNNNFNFEFKFIQKKIIKYILFKSNAQIKYLQNTQNTHSTQS